MLKATSKFWKIGKDFETTRYNRWIGNFFWGKGAKIFATILGPKQDFWKDLWGNAQIRASRVALLKNLGHLHRKEHRFYIRRPKAGFCRRLLTKKVPYKQEIWQNLLRKRGKNFWDDFGTKTWFLERSLRKCAGSRVTRRAAQEPRSPPQERA